MEFLVRRLIALCVIAVALPCTAAAQNVYPGVSAQGKDRPLKPGSVKARILREGKDWHEMAVEGRLPNGSRITEKVLGFDGMGGLKDAPLTPEVRAFLSNDKGWNDDPGAAAYFGESALNSVEKFVQDYVISCSYNVTHGGVQCQSPLVDAVVQADAACPDEDDEKLLEHDVQKSFGKRMDIPPIGPAEAQVEVVATIKGPVRVRVPFHKKMALDPLNQCIAVGFSMKPIVVSGEPVFGLSVPNIGGTFSTDFQYNWPIASETLGEIAFVIGTVPVTIDFALAEKIGVTIGLTAGVKVHIEDLGTALNTDFSYTCDKAKGLRDFCQGATHIKPPTKPSPRLTSLTVSGEASVMPWFEAVLRAGLYSSVADSVFIGLAPYGKASLWGALPTQTCDMDGDGHLDVITGLLADADVGVHVQGGLGSDIVDTIRNFVPFASNEDSTSTEPTMVTLADIPFHAAMFDGLALTGGSSGVLNPIARVNGGSGRVGQELRVRFRMNDCYPYADDMDYSVDWGDGSAASTVTFEPNVETSAGHTYATAGQKTITVKAVRDDHGTGPSAFGRSINRSATIHVTVTQ